MERKFRRCGSRRCRSCTPSFHRELSKPRTSIAGDSECERIKGVSSVTFISGSFRRFTRSSRVASETLLMRLLPKIRRIKPYSPRLNKRILLDSADDSDETSNQMLIPGGPVHKLVLCTIHSVVFNIIKMGESIETKCGIP